MFLSRDLRMGGNVQIYLWRSRPSLQPTAVFADGKGNVSSWNKRAKASQNFRRYITGHWKGRQQASEILIKGKISKIVKLC